MCRIAGSSFYASILPKWASPNPFWSLPERAPEALGVFPYFTREIKNAPDSSWEGAHFSLSGASSSLILKKIFSFSHFLKCALQKGRALPVTAVFTDAAVNVLSFKIPFLKRQDCILIGPGLFKALRASNLRRVLGSFFNVTPLTLKKGDFHAF